MDLEQLYICGSTKLRDGTGGVPKLTLRPCSATPSATMSAGTKGSTGSYPESITASRPIALEQVT